MAIQLTEDQIAKYVAGEGCNCPFCDSDELEGGSINIEGNNAYQGMFCHSCNAGWDDVYVLSGIAAIKE